MKLLLTSNGLSNPSIANALFGLVGKPASETTIAFIPTAMNVGRGDKGWFINDLSNIKKQNCKFVDIVDISALPKKIWLPRLEDADVLFFSGGHTSHLMYWLNESGLAELLPGLLKTRVYAGISAGSIVTNPDLGLSRDDKKIYYEEMFGYRDEKALNFVDFYVRPHFKKHDFLQDQKDFIENFANLTGKAVYLIDDNSALKIIEDKLEVITEGDYLVFNKYESKN